METGIFKRDTTLFFAKLFDEVHNVEIIKKTSDDAKSRFDKDAKYVMLLRKIVRCFVNYLTQAFRRTCPLLSRC